jgi:succinate dehydrogenase/fumarate reductase flavoprotein subunit
MVPGDGKGEDPAPFPHFSDRGRPGIMAVGPNGERFVNESASYHDFVSAMLERGFDHAWLLADHRALRRYGLGAVRPFPSPWAHHLASGYLRQGRDWAALARVLGLPADRLQHTVAVFNQYAERGQDPFFHRGQSLFDQRCGDAEHQPNPALDPLQTAPFYAVKLLPGDIGTFIGLPTDGAARVLNNAGTPVPGLYAAGNAAQSLFGGHYPSAGITLGPALTFGWLAARHALGTADAPTPPAHTQEPHPYADAAYPLA